MLFNETTVGLINTVLFVSVIPTEKELVIHVNNPLQLTSFLPYSSETPSMQQPGVFRHNSPHYLTDLSMALKIYHHTSPVQVLSVPVFHVIRAHLPISNLVVYNGLGVLLWSA